MRRLLIALAVAAAAVIAAGATWTSGDTYRASYALLRAPADEDASTIDLTTGGLFADKPASAVQVGTLTAAAGDNAAVQVIFCGGDAENDTFSWRIYGWRYGNGPAEYVASGTGILGTQAAGTGPESAVVAADTYWADTLTITGGQHWMTAVETKDSGNNRIAKLVFDFFGYDWLYCEISSADGSTGIEAGDIAVYYSVVN